jgi:hypothetical protein
MRTSPPPTPDPGVIYPHWFIAATLLGAIGFLLRNVAAATVADLDMFHELALIREALELGRIPYSDHYAFVPTVYPVVHHEWATGAVLYLFSVTTGWGMAGISLLRWLLVVAIAAGAWIVARRRGGDPLLMALLAGAAAMLVAPGLSPVRAQMFTYLFVIAMLLLAPAHERLRWRFVVAWLAIVVVWLNMHGGFLVGFGLFALLVVEQASRSWVEHHSLEAIWRENRYLLTAVVAMPALMLVNPYGWHYPGFVLDAVRMDRPLIAEWAPLWDPRVHPVLLLGVGTSLLVLLYAVLRRRRLALLPGLPMLIATTYFAIRHQRIVPIYGVLWFCLVPGYLAGTPLETLLRGAARRFRPLVATGLFAIAVFGGWTVVRERAWQVRIPESPAEGEMYYPVGAARFLQQVGFSGNLMTTFDSGSYVMWTLYPDVRIGMDSRYEVAYPPEWMLENAALYLAEPGWRKALERYGPDAVLVPVGAPLDDVLRQPPTQALWHEWYRDGGFALYGRTAAAGPS